jgi:hypothetical protein
LYPILVVGGIRHTLVRSTQSPAMNIMRISLACLIAALPAVLSVGAVRESFSHLHSQKMHGKEPHSGKTVKDPSSKKAVKDPICKLSFFQTTPLCSVCEDQQFYFYVGHQQGEYQYCNRGFSHVEFEYLTYGRVPANPKGYASVEECCEENGGCEPNLCWDYCLCAVTPSPDTPAFCQSCFEYPYLPDCGYLCDKPNPHNHCDNYCGVDDPPPYCPDN